MRETCAPAPIPPAEFERWTAVSRIETDRFCFACWYNLHGQLVRREPAMEILLCRCPECGRFHPVSVPGTRSDLWKQRFATAMAGTWILLAISLALTAGISHGIWTYLTLDELTGWNGNVMQVHQHDSPEYKWFIAGMMACSFGQGGLLILLAVVFLSHWRWPAHLGLVAAWAVLPGAVVACEWWYEAPTLIGWGIHWITAHAAAYAAGGLVALVYGLRFVRLLVRILVPPGWRKPVTAFLERP